MPNKIYLDCYNILHKVPEFRRLLDQSAEAARDELIKRIAALAAIREEEYILVFDGSTSLAMTEQVSANVKIMYSEGHTADTVIERAVYNSSNRSEIVAVSTDVSLRRLVMGMGASVMSPKNFFAEAETALNNFRARKLAKANRPLISPLSEFLDEDTLSSLEGVKGKPES